MTVLLITAFVILLSYILYAGKNSVDGGNNTNVLWRDYLAKGEILIKRIIRL